MVRYTLLILLFSLNHSNAQNLLSNGSAETIDTCYLLPGVVTQATGWKFGNGGSIDVYNKCSPHEYTKVPYTMHGYQEPVHGNGFFGIGMSSKINAFYEYYEYPMYFLDTPLEKDTVYEVSFFVVASKTGNVYTDRIGVLFSKWMVFAQSNSGRIDTIPQIESPKGMVFSDTANWVQVKDTFTATGVEKVMTLGWFNSIDDMTIQEHDSIFTSYASYVFIDSIVVKKYEKPKRGELNLPNVFTPNDNLLDDYYFAQSKNLLALKAKIYNRWGGLVYSSNEIDFKWDGKKDGVDLAEGVYFIMVEATDLFGNRLVNKQSIVLIR